MTAADPWDALSHYFDTSRADVQSGSADNILIAWPVILRFLADHAPEGRTLRVLDYGCGGGAFAHALSAQGSQVVGIDASSAMIETARRVYGERIDFRVGNAQTLAATGPFDIITAIMVFQFVEDMNEMLRQAAAALPEGGLLVFAVFNPAYVVERSEAGRAFLGFDSNTNPTTGFLEFSGGIRVPTFIRTARAYNELAQSHGLTDLMEAYPPFTEEFLARFPQSIPTKHSEYLILGYEKRSTPRDLEQSR